MRRTLDLGIFRRSARSGFSTRGALARLILSLWLAATFRLHAHEDPFGDLHRDVVVENGNFAIYFQNSRRENPANNYTDRRALFRTVYAPDGKLLAPRHPVEKPPLLPNHAPGVYGVTLGAGDERLIFTQELLRDRPSYWLETRGRRERRRLPWPADLKLNFVHDIHAADRSLVFAATVGESDLTLFHFDRDSLAQPLMASLGRPAMIYNFPRASNLVPAAGRYWLGWMRITPDGKGLATMLTSWKPGEAAAHTVLPLPSDWNVDLSLATTGGWLCLAYHCATGGDSHADSRIITHFQKLPE